MSESDTWRRPDVMGGPDEPADVLAGGEEPPGANPDVMDDGKQRPADVLAGGRESAGEDPDVIRRGREPAAEDPDVMSDREE
jgi:hypothetical protein